MDLNDADMLLQLALLSMGFGIIISSVTTKYRDLAKLVGFGVQLWMYGSPVAYDMYSMAAFAPGGKWHTLYMCNPVTSLINLFRYGGGTLKGDLQTWWARMRGKEDPNSKIGARTDIRIGEKFPGSGRYQP